MQKNTSIPQSVTSSDLPKIAAGKSSPEVNLPTPPVSGVKDPVYVTLAIGEDGGKLPDILS